MQVLLLISAVVVAIRQASCARVSNGNVAWTSSDNLTGEEHCCCKQKKCEEDAMADGGTHDAFYSPQDNLCCKFKSRPCGHIFQFSGYKTPAPTKEYCTQMLDDTFKKPATEDGEPHEAVRVEDLTPGTNEHTVHKYCEFPGDADPEEQGDAEAADSSGRKAKIVKAMVSELSNNSIDAMAKEMFSLYLCHRWAPSADFVRAGNSEIATGQLANTSSVLEHYVAHRFMPLRCTRNVNVYGGDPALGQTHFDMFEQEMGALAQWYEAEAGNTMQLRLERLQDEDSQDIGKLNSSATSFDIEAVSKVVAGCPADAKILINTRDASPDQLLADCGAARWWLRKLMDWHEAMPFTSFMMPDAVAAEEVHPTKGEQVLVCFGKRVASQLHRREGGDHLMTDQSMVGCHGFWDLPMAAKMLERTVSLWRPPTCQLAAMELDMKMKIMDLTATMNTQLFDALPAMLVDEMNPEKDGDGNALQAAQGAAILKGVWSSMITAFSSLSGKYQRLGQLLGNTVTKWLVCPVKPISNHTDLEQLDMALGTEDKLAQYYAKTAYSKWTGEHDLLPGELCNRDGADKKLPGMPNASQCSLAVMQEDAPEPYRDENFVCPVLPMLPSKQQLDIFRKKHTHCLMRMSMPQMTEQNWYYRGRQPHRKQYNVTENLPSQRYQYVKALDVKSRPDTDFGIWRHFVTVGQRCTEEEMALTPRWCRAPEVVNEPSWTRNLLTAGTALGGAVAGVVRSGLEAGGVVEETPSNNAVSERLGSWLYGQAKTFEKWMKSSGEWVGRASTRYQRLYERSFEEVEIAELIHSASFQASQESTGGDSKSRRKFDRYAVVTECLNFDPGREFRLKYTWSEKAINLARKAHQKFGESGLLSSGGFFVQLRGAGVLSMRNENNAWMTNSAYVRAAAVGGDVPSWIETNNPYLQEMSGALSASSGAVAASSLLGFQATFACGSRLEMHGLPQSFEGRQGNFSKCVKEGKAKNEELRVGNPGEGFLKEETVIRVTFAPLESCYREVVGTLNNANETKNPVLADLMSIKGCKTESPPEELPDVIKRQETASTYRGRLLGKGLPTETLLEVLIDPEDFLMEVSL